MCYPHISPFIFIRRIVVIQNNDKATKKVQQETSNEPEIEVQQQFFFLQISLQLVQV